MRATAVHPAFGRYELLCSLGRGGMAEVFLARIAGAGGFSKLLVIKRMLPHLSEDAEFVHMFLDEARITARLTHPNVCQVHELGDVDGVLYIAMEYLEGLVWSELAPLVAGVGDTFALRCIAAVLGQISEGLHHAHELRDHEGNPTPVIHRDVSPQNLMVTTPGICKLFDFGVSKVLTEATRTRSGTLKGKLPYMAPEQIRGEPIDPRADVFSMGIVLWEALTSEGLFHRESDYQIWRAVTEDPIPKVTTLRPALPPAIDDVVARTLARDPNDRYPSIRTFAAELREVAEQVGGPLDSVELADAVRTLGAEQLAVRSQRVSQFLGATRPSLEPHDSASLTLPKPSRESEPVAQTVAFRDRATPLRRRRSRVALTAALVAGLAAIGGVIASWASDPEPRSAIDSVAPTRQAATDFVIEDLAFDHGGPNVVLPGTVLAATASVWWWARSGCPDCIVQVVYGVDDQNPRCAVHGMPGVWPGMRTKVSLTFQAPLTPGVHHVYATMSAKRTCADARAHYKANAVRQDRKVGVIVVRPP